MENKKQWKLSITSKAFGAFRVPAVKSFLLIMLALTWCSAAYAQKTAQGQVIDEAGEAVIGASVLIKGSTYGTFSDVNGSAAAIYGTRANAEVVLITTKRGKMGQDSPISDVEYNGWHFLRGG
jgi:hypothetical protein